MDSLYKNKLSLLDLPISPLGLKIEAIEMFIQY